jgi:hypothetical protein
VEGARPPTRCKCDSVEGARPPTAARGGDNMDGARPPSEGGRDDAPSPLCHLRGGAWRGPHSRADNARQPELQKGGASPDGGISSSKRTPWEGPTADREGATCGFSRWCAKRNDQPRSRGFLSTPAGEGAEGEDLFGSPVGVHLFYSRLLLFELW